MRFEGKDTIRASRSEVWEFLTDAESVSKCTPGLESMEILEPNKKFQALGSLGLGTVKLKFKTVIEWTELKPPETARMKMKGTAPGSSIDVVSEVHLSDAPNGATEIVWSADVTVVGSIASLAARLMKPVTAKMTQDFFTCVRKKNRGMKFGPVPLDRAEGKILGHNVAGPDGKRMLRKGRALRREDVEALRGLGRRTVYVAELEPLDIEENAAALRIAEAAVGPGLRLSGSSTGRVNLISTVLGIFRFPEERLRAVNASEGVTVACLASDAVVRPGLTVATVKVIPYAVPAAEVERGERVARGEGPLFRVDALSPKRVGLVLSGSPSVSAQLIESFTPARGKGVGARLRRGGRGLREPRRRERGGGARGDAPPAAAASRRSDPPRRRDGDHGSPRHHASRGRAGGRTHRERRSSRRSRKPAHGRVYR